MRSPERQWRLLCLLAGLTVFFLAATFLIPFFVNREIRRQVLDYIVMRPGAAEDTYERFTDTTTEGDEVSYYTEFYFFNITNLDAVRLEGAKPVLEEIGPYTYSVVDLAYDLAFHWNGTLSYKTYSLYHRLPEMTTGDYNDEVVTLNLALIGVLDQILGESSFWLDRVIAQLAAAIDQSGDGTNEGIFMRRSVEELLWGYDEPVLELLAPVTDVSSQFYLMLNGTSKDPTVPPPGLSRIDTGLNDVDRLGQIELWNGLEALDLWNNYSDPVKGTTGTMFKPFLKKHDVLTLWLSDMYRSIPLRRSGDDIVNGINTYRYTIDPKFWEPDARFFGNYDGLINITEYSGGGFRGPPIFFSPVYFCGVDPALQSGVVGLTCNGNDREFYIDVEPYSGVSLKSEAYLMVSSEYSDRYSAIDPHLNHTFLPIFWLNQYRKATEDQTEPIHSKLYRALDLRFGFTTAALVLTCICGVGSLMCGIAMLRRRQQRRRLEERMEPSHLNDGLLPLTS